MQELKEALRTKVNSYQKYSDQSTLTENVNNVVYEARQCFGFATDLFKDIQKFIEQNEKRLVMAQYKRSRIWQMLEETTTFIMAVFEREVKKYLNQLWKNLIVQKTVGLIEYGNTRTRRCHLDVVDARETKGLYMFHCCVFPRLNSPHQYMD